MTQEEKARAYDEVLNKLRHFIAKGVDPLITRADVQDFFPELKESEDEKVRKEIVRFIQMEVDDEIVGNKWLAWLGKQGDYANFRDKAQVGDRITKNEDGVLVNLSQLKRVAKPSEKKGEQKASYTTIVKTGDGGINALVTRELPTDSEQKPADKVESHFHVEKGKWYMCIKNNVGITKGNAYYGISDGYIIDDNGRKYNCKNWAVFQGYLRLWDITIDARDGDVLYLQHDGKEHIIIYKGVIKERFRTFVSAYCAYNGIVDAFCFADVSRYADLAYGGIVPATKEQRDTLLKAMVDAGYTFDFEKKELKKIEPKPEENKGNICGISPNSAWSEEDEENFCSVYLDVKSARQNTVNSLSGDLKEQEQKRMDEVISWLESLKGRVQPKQEWSEEDKYMYDILCGTIENTDINENTKYKLISWLKSLKDRVGCEAICTTTKEWSEEDEQHIDSLLKRLDSLCKNKFERTRFAISEDRDWLKSLRPQNRWKPSEEQMEELEEVIESNCFHTLILQELLEQLKKLKEE